ncbi:MAG TPA: radical SAM protein [Anaerolineae bacterium]|nr:radical SAM protein [Anaerolineae bacterium]
MKPDKMWREPHSHFVRWLLWQADRPRVGPKQVIVDITDRCFFRCMTCDKWKSRATPLELMTAEWLNALQRVFEWLGPYHLSLSGGEPLRRRDIFQIIAWASEHGVTTNLMTNGWLVDAQTAQELVEAGLTNLTFSLNSFNPATHDRTRGMPGSHARIVAGIGHMQRARAEGRGRGTHTTISLNTIVCGAMAAELPELVRWAREVGLDAVGLQPLVDVSSYQPYHAPQVTYRPDWTANNDLWNGDRQQIDAAIEQLIALKQQGYPILGTVRQLHLMGAYLHDPTKVPPTRCYVGINNFLIDPYGGVRLCYTMDPIGNIRTERPEVIWSSTMAARVRGDIRACQLGCRLLNCNYQPSAAERARTLGQRLIAS